MTTDATSAVPPADKPAPRRRAPLRGWRKWLYRLLAMTVVPLCLLGLLELGLRLGGFGHPTSFFLDGGQAGVPGSLIENRHFSRRFFPPSLQQPTLPSPFAIPASKEPGTYRIFVLGESAAMGFPDPSSGFARVLEVMLRERYPRTRFEVVNTAMVAINSHVILQAARDCA